MWAEFAFQIFDIVVSVVSFIFIIYTILFQIFQTCHYYQYSIDYCYYHRYYYH